VNRRILVADDSDNIRNVLQLNFEWKGYEVLAAADGEEAVRLVDRMRPDLIILDVMMPRKNGFQVCRQVKSDSRTSDIPVIILTAKNQKEDRHWGQDCGADEYITKPFNTPALEKVVERLLEHAVGEVADEDEGKKEDSRLQESLDRTIAEGVACGVGHLRLDAKPLMVHRQKYGEILHGPIFEVVVGAIIDVLGREHQDVVMEEDRDCFLILITATAERVRAIQREIVECSNLRIIDCYGKEDRERGFVASRDFHTREEIQIPLVTLQVEKTLLYNQD
jgi:DNA-binding response OmpR family regulator